MYSGLNEKLNSSFNFDETVDNLKKDIQIVDQKKNEISTTIKSSQYLVDQEYLLTDIKTLIQINRNVLEKLDQDIKIGSDARKYEVFAELSTSIVNQYRSLIELNKIIYDAKKKEELQANMIAPKEKDKIVMSHTQLIDMIQTARDSNQMKKIDIKFDVKPDKEIVTNGS